MPIAVYISFILYITVGVRADSLIRKVELIPFWSYIKIIGEGASLKQTILNVLLFIPLGYLLVRCVKKPIIGLMIGSAVSLTVECIQFLTFRGTASETDAFRALSLSRPASR